MSRNLPLPRGWNRRVRSSILHILALSHYTFTAFLGVNFGVGGSTCPSSRFDALRSPS